MVLEACPGSRPRAPRLQARGGGAAHPKTQHGHQMVQQQVLMSLRPWATRERRQWWRWSGFPWVLSNRACVPTAPEKVADPAALHDAVQSAAHHHRLGLSRVDGAPELVVADDVRLAICWWSDRTSVHPRWRLHHHRLLGHVAHRHLRYRLLWHVRGAAGLHGCSWGRQLAWQCQRHRTLKPSAEHNSMSVADSGGTAPTELVCYVNGVRRVLPQAKGELTLLQYLRGACISHKS
jgi:hypothetical protein